ncbi:E3 ubiquitin-protein ligase HERC2 [Phytophthora cinnamomi]|uniref:E3 ubiquitin-protein ligase HERC2 n=1 Tax=Phytophthora cinnamomi TaxID=4785 RepID=UPI00355ACD5C|nr:E3 ubiquitin-protein ligase HERC2 [Phytophthora cinnamomi]
MKRLAIFRRNIVRAVSAGDRLSLFLTDGNRVFQSGRLFMKQDGCKMWKPVEITMEAAEGPSTGGTIVAVEAGHLAAYALDDQGRVYSWGTQIFGQLGHDEELEPELAFDSIAGDTNAEINDDDGDNLDDDHDAEEEEEGEEEEEPQAKIVIVERSPRLVDLPRAIPSSSFITQLSIGSHHSLAQLRIKGEVDRWRKFPLGGVVTTVSHEEHGSKVSLCLCKSSQTTTSCVLGICVQCETCRVSPLCRVCCRRCHAGHVLQPLAVGRGLQRDCVCSEEGGAPCLFGTRLPFAIQEESKTTPVWRIKR